MGLGKTLQTICILASDHHQRQLDFATNKNPSSAPLPSIVVCPPTWTGHWVDEVEKFVGAEHLNPLHYTGPPSERQRLRKRVAHHNLVIASYDIVRNDLDFFSSIRWNYCVLNEGHIIKNGKTKSSKAIKQLIANHRLILSGTPIQNNVLELWSLFDFLIPGFLGTEKQFQVSLPCFRYLYYLDIGIPEFFNFYFSFCSIATANQYWLVVMLRLPLRNRRTVSLPWNHFIGRPCPSFYVV